MIGDLKVEIGDLRVETLGETFEETLANSPLKFSKLRLCSFREGCC